MLSISPESITHLTESGSAVQGLRIRGVDVFFGANGGKFPDGNQVIVRGRHSTAAFDTPMVSNLIPEELAKADIVLLSHVHEDHTAGLHLLPDVPVHAPQADLAALQSIAGLALHYGYSQDVGLAMIARAQADFHFVPRPDAQGYDDGATWDLGGVRLRALHMPGHTHGHSVLIVENEGIAFIGDIDLSGFGPYYGDACSDLPAFRRTLDLIRDVPASVWVTSHHKGVVTKRERFLELLSVFGCAIDRRDQALLGALASRPMTLAQLVARRFVYPVTFNDVFVPDVERRVITQHLTALLTAGQITREGELYAAV